MVAEWPHLGGGTDPVTANSVHSSDTIQERRQERNVNFLCDLKKKNSAQYRLNKEVACSLVSMIYTSDNHFLPSQPPNLDKDEENVFHM
jgi:hypothetical protein